LVNGDEESKTGFDGAGESTTNNLAGVVLPACIKAVELHVVVSVATANASNVVRVVHGGNANFNQALDVRGASANGYATSGNGKVQTNAGKIKVFFDVGAGLVTGYLKIMGYYV
jgi:hypothetical protein